MLYNIISPGVFDFVWAFNSEKPPLSGKTNKGHIFSAFDDNFTSVGFNSVFRLKSLMANSLLF